MSTIQPPPLPLASNLPAIPATSSAGSPQMIWRALAANTNATIVVKCPHDYAETLIQAVKKIKSTENANRKRMDDPELPHWGRLRVVRDRKKGTVGFSLTYALGDLV